MKILLGGTFSVLHEGHKKMIMEGLKLGELYIGITSDYYPFNKNMKFHLMNFARERLKDL
jgi:Predicted nucleotidyltransferase